MDELKDAVDLKIRCWTEELAGVAENTLNPEDELSFYTAWAMSEKENNDRRILLGAFSGEELAGAAFGSFAEEYDGMDAMELNGLWVEDKFRGQGISLMLIKVLIDEYMSIGKQSMIVYNHHFAPSSSYYRKLHGDVIRQVKQLDGQLLVDVFLLPFDPMDKELHEMLEKHKDKFIVWIDLDSR